MPVPLVDPGRRDAVDGLAAFPAAPTPRMPSVPLTDGDRRDLAVYLLSSGRSDATRSR